MIDPKPYTREDGQYMRMALRLAHNAWPSPNPRVGAVVVRDGRVVGCGFHQEYGGPHAEVQALAEAGDLAHAATLYVTLEPCCHQGRTGPCTAAILKAGVGRVIAGCRDANPRVSGKGLQQLRAAGVDVREGLCAEEASRLIAGHSKFMTSGLPHVIWKYAMTLDGKVATVTGKSRWISGEASRREVHRMRRDSDAVLVGIGTVLADDPELNVRLPRPQHQPYRVVLDSRARLSVSSRLLRSDGGRVIVAVSEAAPVDSIRRLEDVGAAVIVAGAQRVDITQALRSLASTYSVREVLLEGGPELAASALGAGVVDHIVCFIAGKLFGGATAAGPLGGQGISDPALAPEAHITRIRKLGEDAAIYAALGNTPEKTA